MPCSRRRVQGFLDDRAFALATPMPWNLVASAYEAEVLPTFRHFAEEALRLAAPAAGSRVADVACGPGTLALIAARAGFTVDAIDFSPEMIAGWSDGWGSSG
jgi:2-polyprenyl-3-methyl-5-hydroxy-6-metoxy-1,4-benzoquinol methylase